MEIRPMVAELFHADGQTNIRDEDLLVFATMRMRL